MQHEHYKGQHPSYIRTVPIFWPGPQHRGVSVCLLAEEKDRTGNPESAAGFRRAYNCLYIWSRNKGASYLSWLLTPATVCLAIPLYKQLHLLKEHGDAVVLGITAGVATSAVSVFLLCRVLGLTHTHYVTLLPKSITTAIGMGVSEEAGGIVTLTVMSIVLTGVLGNMAGESILRLARIPGAWPWEPAPMRWGRPRPWSWGKSKAP